MILCSSRPRCSCSQFWLEKCLSLRSESASHPIERKNLFQARRLLQSYKDTTNRLTIYPTVSHYNNFCSAFEIRPPSWVVPLDVLIFYRFVSQLKLLFIFFNKWNKIEVTRENLKMSDNRSRTWRESTRSVTLIIMLSQNHVFLAWLF